MPPMQQAEGLHIYQQEIAKYHPLSTEKEHELAYRIKNGDANARNQLIEANLRFVIAVAAEYRDSGLAFEDLVSAGNLGLMKAVDRFDSSLGFRFITYAVWWIRQSLSLAVMIQTRTVRIPINRQRLAHRLNTYAASHQDGSLHHSALWEAAKTLDVSVQKLDALLGDMLPDVPLDAPKGNDETLKHLDILVDVHTPSPLDRLEKQIEKEMIEAALARLKPRERRVIELCYGLWGQAPLSMSKIGDHMGISRERVRQIRNQALEKLRQSRTVKELA